MAPNIKPKPQLNKLTNTVKKVTKAADFAVFVHCFTKMDKILSMGFESAKTCPRTNINIICIANTNNEEFQMPTSQYFNKSKVYEIEDFSVELVKINAIKKVTIESITAIVKGEGRRYLKTFEYLSEKLI